jgi:hypothetical protein
MSEAPPTPFMIEDDFLDKHYNKTFPSSSFNVCMHINYKYRHHRHVQILINSCGLITPVKILCLFSHLFGTSGFVCVPSSNCFC